MSSLSGDKAIASLKLKTNAFVDNFGRISTEPTVNKLVNISEVLNGSVEDILHLVGHQIDSIEELLRDGILSATERVNSAVSQLPVRRTDSYLIQQKDRLFGVIIDSNGETKVVGQVSHVLPDPHLNNNTIKISNTDELNWSLCNTTDLDLEALISVGAIVGLIGNSGHLFLQTTDACDSSQDIPELVLILQNGFFLIENSSLVRNYPKFSFTIGETIASSVPLETGDCVVISTGGCVRNGQRFELYGSGSAVISADKFLRLMSSFSCADSMGSEEVIDISELEPNLETTEEVDEQMETTEQMEDTDQIDDTIDRIYGTEVVITESKIQSLIDLFRDKIV